jgi:hypothetical protein
LDVSEQRHRAYAERHDLIYQVHNGAVHPDWSGHWDAIPLLLELMADKATRWIFWLDADTLIMDDADLRKALPKSAKLGMCRHPGPPEHWNCGVMFVRNLKRTRAWLAEILSRGPGVYPWYQQAIMNELLDTPAWAGLCTQLDDRWNSTVVLNGPQDCHIMAWHADGGPDYRARNMIAALQDREGR